MSINKQYYICADSADLYAWIIRNKNFLFDRNKDYSRTVKIPFNNQVVDLIFVHKFSNRKKYDSLTKNFLSKTAGTPDYILFSEDSENPILCIEDSKTAPVGNSVIQRLDKLWPLMISTEIKCPVVYIGPKKGLDASNKQMRGWEQSWFYKSIAKDIPEVFRLLDDVNQDVCEESFLLITEIISKNLAGEQIQKTQITKEMLSAMNKSMEKHVRTYNKNIFSGKLFQRSGVDAHPAQSTLLLITETRKTLGLPSATLQITETHKQKLLKSKTRRLKRILNNGVNFQ